MAKYISILRGINVGGNRKIMMKDLKSLYERLDFSKVETYIQSGNVLFESEQKLSIKELEEKIQQAIAETFGFDVPLIVRTAEEWTEIIAKSPFWKEKDVDIEKLHLTILKQIPSNESLMKIKEMKFQPDRFEIMERDVFVYCENGYGRTKITNDFFEKKLKISASTRNWKTVIKLHEMVEKN
jgi:uncharacterized protein (DUF1697 family)